MKKTANKHNLKIVFFGSSSFSLPTLLALSEQGYQIIHIVTSPDKPQGRNLQKSATPVADFANQHNISLSKPIKLDDKFTDFLNKLQADIFLVVAYGKFLSQAIINMPVYKTWNLHPSLLPKYRGPSPIPAAIYNCDPYTGVTIMQIDKEMDHGPVLAQKKVNIDSQDTTATLSKKLADAGAELFVSSLISYSQGKINPQPQNHNQATYTKLLKKEDARLDWHLEAKEILALIRAYNPWPGTLFPSGEFSEYKIHQAKISPLKLDVGQIKIDKKNKGIFIGTGSQAIEILYLQKPGKKAVTAIEFLNGWK